MLKFLVDHCVGFGRLLDRWIDEWIGVKAVLRDCLAQSKFGKILDLG
jgi:hypothetical protein